MSTTSTDYNEPQPVVSVAEYRKLLNDETSTDYEILQRLRYIESLCRDLIRQELGKYVNQKNT